jgi:putative Mg2+ transporter-C (MgtC) family protein
VLREAIARCTGAGFAVFDIATRRLDPGEGGGRGTVAVRLELQGTGDADSLRADLVELDGVLAVSVDRPDDAE